MNVVLCSFQFQSNGFEEGFWSGAWTGAFQLVTLAVVALFVNVLYQRYRQLATARQELINEIDQFTIRLYKPRKAYQRIIEGTGDLLTRIPDLERREACASDKWRNCSRNTSRRSAAFAPFRSRSCRCSATTWNCSRTTWRSSVTSRKFASGWRRWNRSSSTTKAPSRSMPSTD